ncbi:hypothetical protein L2E82_36509 [Cichorium intybus]|uniref:Uncharacterized protein n=1 Tax=Cichorium intybus TaxID=13427 RepID=A0ACB9BRV9_CICIN|nr:hypothetical protein L2E82_36509 [Cichorium intybus]
MSIKVSITHFPPCDEGHDLGTLGFPGPSSEDRELVPSVIALSSMPSPYHSIYDNNKVILFNSFGSGGFRNIIIKGWHGVFFGERRGFTVRSSVVLGRVKRGCSSVSSSDSGSVVGVLTGWDFDFLPLDGPHFIFTFFFFFEVGLEDDQAQPSISPSSLDLQLQLLNQAYA